MRNNLQLAGRPTKMQEANFNPDLLTITREAAGLTQSELANRVGIGQNSISRWEARIRIPCIGEVNRIADVLERDAGFFYRSERPLSVDVSLMFHRAKAETRLVVIRMLHAKLNIARIAISSMLRQFASWDVHIQNLSIDDHASGSVVANKVRALWQVSSGPIRNLTELRESPVRLS